mmetsp:Transcript_7152/g.12875  ORF Transcript_7152/g.12875 Transcript_7152/m.12875 type:complete len:116 (-) Transcript_7152:1606-1953(-)
MMGWIKEMFRINVSREELSRRANQEPFKYYGAPFILFVFMGQFILTRILGGRHELTKEQGQLESMLYRDAKIRGNRNFIKKQPESLEKQTKAILDQTAEMDQDYEMVPIKKPYAE